MSIYVFNLFFHIYDNDIIRYQKLHKDKSDIGESPGSETAVPAKYVILEEINDEEEMIP